MLVVGSGALGVSAVNLPNPYFGSDTLFQVTRRAIFLQGGIGPNTAYVGGGSGAGAGAMSAAGAAGDVQAAKQGAAPMSRMIKSEAKVCTFNGVANGGADTNASGIVIGLDAVSVLSSNQSGFQAVPACQNEVASGTPAGIFAGGGTDPQTWKWALALIYGGLDTSTCTGHASKCATQDCNSTARKNLVANWSLLFQGNACTYSSTVQPSGMSANIACTVGATSPPAAGAGQPNGALWHAFRRDDTSGTADVFASILGLSPSTSNSANFGFGTSPYCNAMNWDATAANKTTTAQCNLPTHDQMNGPGGVADPLATNGVCSLSPGTSCTLSPDSCASAVPSLGVCVAHKKPPPGTWGENPLGSVSAKSAWDVLPTQMQDNDPIRRPCLGTGKTNNHLIPGEEVCNLDNALGLVVPMVDSDWIIGQTYPNPSGGVGPALVQYPVNNCNSFAAGAAPKIFNCAIQRNSVHDGECQNGDSETGGACIVPVDATGNTSQCVATKATIPALVQRTTLGTAFGRAYNLHLSNGVIPTDGSFVLYAQYPVNSLGTTVDMAGAFNRIHQVATAVGKGAAACQLVDMTDQIGCLASADPCSIGFAGFEASNWSNQTNPAPAGTDNVITPHTWDADALNIAGVKPGTTTVQALGAAGEYQFSRKLYYNSLAGFGTVNTNGPTAGNPGAPAEILLAQYESVAGNIKPILNQFSFFGVGPLSPQGTADFPFCEDFNEKSICGAGSNNNGCVNNNTVAGVPGETGPNPNTAPMQSTICGDGIVEAFEECDPADTTPAPNKTGSGCSSTCRCVLDYNPTKVNTAPETVGGCN
jgi:cysteine-rich repeat protein